MGSALKRLKKNVNRQNQLTAVGYENELKARKNISRADNFDFKVHFETFNALRIITATCLRDLNGFGQQRLMKFDETIISLLNLIQEKGVQMIRDYSVVIYKEMGVKTRDVLNRVTINEKMILAKDIKPNGKHSRTVILKDIDDIAVTFMGIAYATLTKEFKLSRPAIRRLTDKVIYYIKTLYNYEQFSLSVDDLTEIMMDECGVEFAKLVGV